MSPPLRSTGTGEETEAKAHIGVRPAAEVQQAYESVTVAGSAPGGAAGADWGFEVTDDEADGGRRRELFASGALDALRWALARGGSAPVTGARGGLVPDLYALTAEVDAAAVQLDDPVCPVDARAYALGAHEALAWLCGHTDQRP